MTASITCIGACLGCTRVGVLERESRVCARCVYGKNRGLKWALWMDRCRHDARWARAVYDRIKGERARRLFIEVFGLPPRFDDDAHAEQVEEEPP